MSVRAETVRETGAGPRGLSRRLAALGPGVVLAERGGAPGQGGDVPGWRRRRVVVKEAQRGAVRVENGAGQAGAIRYPRSPRGELDHMRLHRGTSAAPAR